MSVCSARRVLFPVALVVSCCLAFSIVFLTTATDGDANEQPATVQAAAVTPVPTIVTLGPVAIRRERQRLKKSELVSRTSQWFNDIPEGDDQTVVGMFRVLEKHDVPGSDFLFVSTSSVAVCLRMCAILREVCRAVAHRPNASACHLKTADAPLLPDAEVYTAVLQNRNDPFPPLDFDRIATAAAPTGRDDIRQRYQKLEGDNMLSPYYDLLYVHGASAEQCMLLCYGFEGCRAFTFQASVQDCYLKRSYGKPVAHRGVDTYTLTSLPEVRKRERIVFGVLAGPMHVGTRLQAALQTWLRDEESVIYIEDSIGQVKDVVETVGKRLGKPLNCSVVAVTVPQSNLQRSVNGAWKDFVIMRHIVDHYPGADWYSLVDDDSFMIIHNLRLVLASHFTTSKPFYLGALMLAPEMKETVTFIQGGAGILINRAAAQKVVPLLDLCEPSCMQWAGDVRLGCCFAKTSVTPFWELGFWSQTIFKSLGRDDRRSLCPFPVSFHNMREPLWTMELQLALDQIILNKSISQVGMGANFVDWSDLDHHYRVNWKDKYPADLYK